MMKRYVLAAAGVLMAVSLTACGDKGDSSSAALGMTVQEQLTTSTSGAEQGAQQNTTGEDTAASEDLAEAAKAGTLYEQIAASVTLPEMSALSEKYLLNTYGIETNLCSSYVFSRATDVNDGTTIAIFYVTNEADAQTIAAELEKAKAYDSESADGYNAETYEQFTNSVISQKGNLVYWIVAKDRNDIEKLIIDNQ